MIIAVSALAPSLDAEVDPRFGRCGYFVLVNTDDMSFQAIENANAARGGGAGIQSAQLVAKHGAKTVLTGSCGPNAHETLTAAGIGVAVGCSGTVRSAVQQFQEGKLSLAKEPNVAGHHA
ncbi:MAG TPA: NifB/NifX family molybdenum-iron cluster-binding protein [Polyangiaceae bacterium]|nr:MAG: Dinitrogenase iron-molybdenum cofactor [Deltaproteobacteria bacterium ADurb.Bin207]HNS99512.1 NifB/NifX family molybdenum-iron cluster-binding protein [Polyangiaceae bacterium]HNZ21700.1 NifB/NifX family molybdenum-iron cluster-binding protein [Polyangiaceae bacterium]HOD21634.1 NifB/NifX family molybdenum-iron cluster-binding protein [Polyangiaceae bacterium]HOE49539.1 NifB/NifX family molybdenum-iron cluster-binding protein [Polyangiaceae bacterium]